MHHKTRDLSQDRIWQIEDVAVQEAKSLKNCLMPQEEEGFMHK